MTVSANVDVSSDEFDLKNEEEEVDGRDFDFWKCFFAGEGELSVEREGERGRERSRCVEMEERGGEGEREGEGEGEGEGELVSDSHWSVRSIARI